jgi:uncharacterized protein (DUF433 family)
MTRLGAMNAQAETRFAGLYTVNEAALLLRATTPVKPIGSGGLRARSGDFIEPSSRHLYSWIRAGIESTPREDLVLDFQDLVRFRMIVALRSRGISARAVRVAEDTARDLTGQPQPFVTEPLWTYGSSVFLKLQETLFAISRGTQVAMAFLKDFLSPVHHGMNFNDQAIAIDWRPFPGVLIDPEIQFGDPCIEGTRIQTEAVWTMYRAGESEQKLARMYKVTEEQIGAAIGWEATLEQAA